ncbi:hypothetical protein P7K49_002257 [Saguinus oedipus]|uniref:Uncharacterized protein n=1 Tax=Saguinus oedipus TaxID=9490 RepID=A0ABQ9WGV4_SAGOE|nr:hypothetical protein P7K49_002257 [Saguinus oedipus]
MILPGNLIFKRRKQTQTTQGCEITFQHSVGQRRPRGCDETGENPGPTCLDDTAAAQTSQWTWSASVPTPKAQAWTRAHEPQPKASPAPTDPLSTVSQGPGSCPPVQSHLTTAPSGVPSHTASTSMVGDTACLFHMLILYTKNTTEWANH